jgi:hypothetical protein
MKYLKTVDPATLRKEFTLDHESIVEIYHNTAEKIANETDETHLTLYYVQDRLLSGCFDKHSGKMRRSWLKLGSAIRVAQTIGLDKEVMKLSEIVPSLEAENSRSVWWTLRTWDILTSSMFGRPTMIHGKLGAGPLAPPMPIGDSDSQLRIRYHFHHLQKLALISSQIEDIGESNVAQLVPKIDGELQVFRDTLPGFLSLAHPDTSFDHLHPCVILHRIILEVHLQGSLCTLFKRCIQNGCVAPYTDGIKKVYNAASRTIEAINMMVTNESLIDLYTPAFYAFDAAFLICMCVLSKHDVEFVNSFPNLDILHPINLAINNLIRLASISTLAAKGKKVIQHLRGVCENELKKRIPKNEPKPVPVEASPTDSVGTTTTNNSSSNSDLVNARPPFITPEANDSLEDLTMDPHFFKDFPVSDFLSSMPESNALLGDSFSWIDQFQLYEQ